MHLILAYCIDSKMHIKNCSIAQAKLMLLVEHGTLVDLAVYIFMTRQAKALSYELSALPYGLLLTQFLNVILIPEGVEELKGHLLLLINKTILSPFYSLDMSTVGAGSYFETSRAAFTV